MYTMEDITNFEDLQSSEFDSLFASSLPYMEAGTYSWDIFDNPADDTGKKEALRSRVQSMLENNPGGRSKCLVCRKDGHPIQIFVGTINSTDDDYVTWIIALYGPDANGSKSWLYDLDYSQLCKDHFLNVYGVLGYKVSCINNQSLMNFHMNKPSNAWCTVEVSDPQTVRSFEMVTITYTYN